MSKFEKYINAANIVYHDKLVDIISTSNEIIYRSDKMKDLLQTDNHTIIENNDKSAISLENTLLELNKKLNINNPSIKFLCMGNVSVHKTIIARGVKRLIINGNSIIGVLTILYPAKTIAYDILKKTFIEHSFCFKLNVDQKLTAIEEEILFFTSLGFTQSEIFDLLLSTKTAHYINSIDNIKYYSHSLLKKFGTNSLETIIDNVDELKNKTFIPKSLIKNNGIILQ